MQDVKAPAVARDLPATGRVLAGRYRVGQLVRSGGMGSVYEGEHTATGRRVALKLVHLHSSALSELEDRFEREARIASNVQSKHIVQVFDAGRDEVLGPFIAMELLRGEDLEDRLARTGPFPARVACEIAFQAARGLEKAHAVNIAHRDLKPGNLFLVESDEDEFLVKVLDFGIAKLCDDLTPSNRKLTREGTSVGTPQYMSPEQARGRVDVDARTDIYSLGAVLYEMIVGRSHVPDLANYNQLLIHVATETAPRVSDTLPDVDPRIDRLVAEMLVADRRDRIQTMRRVREKLAPILGSAARMGSMADASGSFRARSELSSGELPSFSSSRSYPVAAQTLGAVDGAEEGDDSEEVLFFDRESVSPEREESPVEAAPDSGEAVVLFDRASLHLPATVDRTSSSAHVIDNSSSLPPPRPLRSEPVMHQPLPGPAAAPVVGKAPARRAGAPPWMRARSHKALLAAGCAVVVFVTLGSVRFVTSSDDASRAAAAPAPAAADIALASSPELGSPAPTELAAAPDAGDSGMAAQAH